MSINHDDSLQNLLEIIEKFTSYTDAIKYAKENGYDAVGINWANDPLPWNTVVIIFNENQILTESQLHKIYEQSKSIIKPKPIKNEPTVSQPK